MSELWSYPPREFEAATGIGGVRGGWWLPEWLNGKPRHHLFRYGDDRLLAIWREVSVKNPRLPSPPTGRLRDYVLGVLSDINLNDIVYWTENLDCLGAIGIQIPDYSAGAHCLCGFRPGWRISAQTFHVIRSHVDRALGVDRRWSPRDE